MPNRDVQVQTREGLVTIPKGTVAWVMETGNDAAIYDLHDTLHTGTVKITANQKQFVLSPGKELLLTKNNNDDFANINPGNVLGYRNVGSTDLGNGVKAYVCDFSIPHGATNIPAIHSLLNSKDPAHRKVGRKILKNAAIIADLSGYPEYETKP